MRERDIKIESDKREREGKICNHGVEPWARHVFLTSSGDLCKLNNKVWELGGDLVFFN